MAQIPSFSFNNTVFEAPLVKLNRDKVYGYVETKYTDSDGGVCNFITILDDGRTMIDQGGVSLKSIDESGDQIDKSTLVARYEDGSIAEQIPSVFDKVNELSTEKGLEDYLLMDVKSVYQLNISDVAGIKAALDQHKVLYLKFNYRAGYDPDDAFWVMQNDSVFIVTGIINEFTYAALALPVVLEDDAEEASDDIDFNMF